MKREKGITLVALIVTVIVLVILGVVAISLIQGEDGIITYAQKAKKDYEKKQGEEAKTIQHYKDEIPGNEPTVTFEINGEEYTVNKGLTLGEFIGEGRKIGIDDYFVSENRVRTSYYNYICYADPYIRISCSCGYGVTYYKPCTPDTEITTNFETSTNIGFDRVSCPQCGGTLTKTQLW